MVEQLTRVFNDAELLEEYNHDAPAWHSYGWDGRGMSPASRLAYVATYGVHVVTMAEQEARDRINGNADTYNQSAHAAHCREAAEVEATHSTPKAGGFVFAVQTGLKCDDGRGIYGEIDAAIYDPEHMAKQEKKPRLCKVLEVYELSATEFHIEQMADKLVYNAQADGREFAGGATIDEADENRRDLFDEYRYYYTLTAAVINRDSGQWFLIDCEGYNYARYCMMPINWREMYADEVKAAEKAKAEREAARLKEEQEAAAARAAEYDRKCAKYAGRLEDLTTLQEAEQIAQKAHGWRSSEYRAACRATMAAQKRNLCAMARTIYPNIKVTAKKSDRYHGAFDVTYYDGPKLETFEAATDYELFTQCTIGRNPYYDCDEYNHAEFVEFGAKYLGVSYGDVQASREWSNETRARLVAAVLDCVPAAADDVNNYDHPHKWSADELRKIAEATGANTSYIVTRWEEAERYYRYIDAERVARWCFDCIDYTTPAPEPKPAPKAKTDDQNADTNRDESSTASAETSEAIADPKAAGLVLITTADGVAVTGSSRATYKARRDIKAHGAQWNKTAKRWEARTPEAVAALCEWFGCKPANAA